MSSYFVSTKDLNKITLNETDPVKSVLQNIKMILATRQLTVPLYRDFGLPMAFLDRPMAAARLLLTTEISEAIAEYEPRANVLNVKIEMDPDVPGKMHATVEVEINDE